MEENEEQLQKEMPQENRVKKLRSWIKNLFLHRFASFRWRKLLPILCFLLAFGLVLSLMAIAVSASVCWKEKERILTIEELEALSMEFDAVLVLGCKVNADGSLSNRLYDRVSVGVSVFQSGLCKQILMSGDSEYPDYDEVGAMRRVAMEQGVEESDILTDPYGLSTYESLLRLRDTFGGRRIVIVTQEYHLYRALYIAEKLGLEAYGVSASLRSYQKQLQMSLREVLARCKDVWCALIEPAPKWGT